MFKKVIKSVKKGNEKGIKVFIDYTLALEEHSNLSKDYINSFDSVGKKRIVNILNLYIEGFKALETAKPEIITPKLKEIHEFVKYSLKEAK